MTTKLALYNKVLVEFLGERKLASLTEAREPRRALDDAYDSAVLWCLRRGAWNFAVRAIEIGASTTLEPAFGWENAFSKPDDWIRTIQVSDNENFDPPLMTWSEEASIWYANVTPLFVQYLSNDALYGLNLGAWPEDFTEFVAARMAEKTCLRITNDKTLWAEIKKDRRLARNDASGDDAMDNAPGHAPLGTWSRARIGPGRYGDRGTRSRLIG